MWEDFGPLLPQIWSYIAEILTICSTLGNKNIKQNLKDSSFHKKETDQKFAKFTTSFSLRMPKIEKDKHKWGKTSAIWLSKYVKIKTLSPLPFPEKTRLLFAIFRLFLPGNRVGSQMKGLESKFDKILEICSNILVPTFSYFSAIGNKETKDISE